MSLLKNRKKKASAVNAEEMIIISFPKVGKTEALTKLPGEYLIVDFDESTKFYDSSSVVIGKNLNVLRDLRKELQESKTVFDYIVLDTLTELYNGIINELAIIKYNKTVETQEDVLDPKKDNITLLPYGKGYTLKRDTLFEVINFFKSYCKCLIITGHIAEKSVDKKHETLTVQDIDIEGKTKNILALKTDAIAIMARTGRNENSLMFTAENNQVLGTRVKHLSNKTIVISEKDKEGNLKTYWDKIFI